MCSLLWSESLRGKDFYCEDNKYEPWGLSHLTSKLCMCILQQNNEIRAFTTKLTTFNSYFRIQIQSFNAFSVFPWQISKIQPHCQLECPYLLVGFYLHQPSPWLCAGLRWLHVTSFVITFEHRAMFESQRKYRKEAECQWVMSYECVASSYW